MFNARGRVEMMSKVYKLSYSTLADAVSKGIPTVSGLPLIGSTLSLLAAGGPSQLHIYVDERHKELGPIYKDRIGPVNGIFLADPTAARKVFTVEGKFPKHFIPDAWLLYNKKYNCKRGLFFMEDDEWLKYRRIMNTVLIKNDVTTSLHHVYEVILNKFLKSWMAFDGRTVDNLQYQLYRLTMSLLFGTLVGSAFIDRMQAYDEALNETSFILTQVFERTMKVMNIPVGLASALNLKVWTDFEDASNKSILKTRDIVMKMLNERLTDGLLKNLLNENLPPDIISILVSDLLMAAADTSVNSVQWSLYLLSQDVEVSEKLRHDPTIARGILREALRLYPSAPFIARYLANDVTLLDYDIPKGQLVMISMYTMGRLKRAYSDPNKFWPERWSRTKCGGYQGVYEPLAYIPFALGARSCIGRKLAEAHSALILQKVVSEYHLNLKQAVNMELKLVPVPSKPIEIEIKHCQ